MARSWNVVFDPKLDPKYLSSLLSRIDVYTKILKETPMPPGVREEIDRTGVVKAIRGTTGIEGNKLEEKDVAELLEAKPAGTPSLEEQEVINAEAAIMHIRRLPPMPLASLTEGTIQELHAITTLECDYRGNKPGVYRRHQCRTGAYNCPDYLQVPRLMNRFADYINSRDALTMHPAVRAVVAHFYLVAIHPFGDGNGRTGRAVEAYLLFHGGYGHAGFYALADYYYRHRGEYIEELDESMFEHEGSLRNFVLFGLEGFEDALAACYGLSTDYLRKLAYRHYLRELLNEDKINARIARVLSRFADEDIRLSIAQFKDRTVPWLADAYKGLTERSVRHDLTVMRKLELINDRGGIVRINYRAVESR